MYPSIKIILAGVATMLFVQCKTPPPAYSVAQENKSIYISQFKLTYFRQLLRAGFNHSEEIEKIISSDRSGYTEPILHESDYTFIDSLVKVDNSKLVADSIARIGKVAEGAEGKHIFDFLLEKVASKSLDTIANKRYKNQEIKPDHY